MLRGTKHMRRGAASWSTSSLGATFQKELPLNLFVYPATTTVPLPDVFTKYAVVPDRPVHAWTRRRSPTNRQQWQDQWTQIVLR